MAVVPTYEACLVNIAGLQFSFYTPDEIRRLSVRHITCPIPFNENGEAVCNGPHDLALGPLENLTSCATCGLDEEGCPGHFGHIDLPLPVYNSFFFSFMFNVLRSVCLHCFELRISKQQIEQYLAAFTFLRRGEIVKARSIRLSTKPEKLSDEGRPVEEDLLKEARMLRQKYSIAQLKRFQMTSNENMTYQDYLKQFLEAMKSTKDCVQCGCRSPKFKKEASSKIFLLPLTDTEVTNNNTNGTVPCSLLSQLPLGQTGQREFVTQMEVLKILEKLWSKQHEILDVIGGGSGFGADGYKAFFFEVVPVLPNRYRPTTRTQGDRMSLHCQTTLMIKLINTILDIRSAGLEPAESVEKNQDTSLIEKTIQKWTELQTTIDQIIGGSTSRKDSGIVGIKQFLEKKEGLFRKHMMGKRVNFAARSTISPDINLGVGEIGIPPYFAKTLSFPEKINQWNFRELQRLVARGPDQHPGAVAVENDRGIIFDLAYMPDTRRKALANRLYIHRDPLRSSTCLEGEDWRRKQPCGAIRTVYRHVKNGDMLLTNRQPTLHKASLMAHKARVLPGERTIRFHYANCASFNADFDGDEMNLHFPQDHMSRAEGYGIMHAHHQYINPSNGAPLRGLIQDSIDAGVLMSKKDSFFRKADYCQLVYSALARSSYVEESLEVRKVEKYNSIDDEIHMEVPAILKPVRLWSGKQTISTVLNNLSEGMPALTTSKSCKTPAEYWGDPLESETCFRQGVFVTGVLDKSQYGSYGLVHACQEVYGDEFAGHLLSALSRMFVFYFQMTGFTCGLSHAFMNKAAEKQRKKMLSTAEWKALQASAKVAGLELEIEPTASSGDIEKEKTRIASALKELYRQDQETGKLHDAKVKTQLQALSSELVMKCLPDGLIHPFRNNGLTVMTSTGAKGSFVNFSQISCLLGQQELEGRRVPRTVTGRTLPCFPPFDPGARSGGFVGNRFLTGLKPPEYFFHCMAGREGLVDTSVKTANSGYLQRCLVKSLETIKVQYDNTVRDDSDGTILQFYYGEDGLDVSNSTYLNRFKFMAENFEAYKSNLRMKSALRCSKMSELRVDEHEIKKLTKKRIKLLQKGGTLEQFKALAPIMSEYKPTLKGSMSETMIDELWDYTTHNPNWLLHDQDDSKLRPKDLEQIVKLKYMESLASPGEAVGVIAAQSVGEPSTQMTLNTFHMAGRGEANVTLGIPRLREILMTASQNMKTPVMILPLKVGLVEASAKTLAARLRKITIGECIKGLYVEEYPFGKTEMISGGYGHVYRVVLEFEPLDRYPKEINITWKELQDAFEETFVPRMQAMVKKALKRSTQTEVVSEVRSTVNKEGGDEQKDGEEGEGPSNKNRYEDDEENEENDEGKLQYKGGRSEKAYDAPDMEDAAFLKASMETLDIEDHDNSESENEETKDKNATPKSKRKTKTAEKLSVQEKKTFGVSCDVSCDSSQGKCELILAFDLNAPKLLMLNFAETVAATTPVRVKEGIERCYVVEGKQGRPFTVQTDGINISAGWENSDLVDVNKIQCNDVAAMLNTYGIEAARSTLVNECKAVFDPYGIEVNPRHLGLIADYMTNQGEYRGCNFYGIRSQASSLLKMSFERCTHFIREAVLAGENDPMLSPAARIVTGRPPLVGTGCMDILCPPQERR